MSCPSKQRGISTIEALIAATIVGVGLLGVAKFQAQVIKQSGSVQDRSKALNAIDNQFEKFRLAAPGTFYSSLISDTDSNNGVLNGALAWDVNEQQQAPYYKSVNVSLNWTGTSGDIGSSIKTYFSPQMTLSSGQTLYEKKLDVAQATTFNATISGTVTKINGNGSWTITPSSPAICVVQVDSYSCSVIGLSLQSTQSITVTFAPSDTVCGSSSSTQVLTSALPNATVNFVHAVNPQNCP